MSRENLFDLRLLFCAIDSEREREHLSWAALARAVGVSSSTIRRFADADDAEADGVLALVRWLGVAPEDYVVDSQVKGQLLPHGEGPIVRVDMELVALANNESGGARGRTRTTIQRLAATAQQTQRSVASLTRTSHT